MKDFFHLGISRELATSQTLYSIQVITQPSGAKGGEPFEVQPQIAVYDQAGILSPDLIGYVYAEVGSSPSGYEALWTGTCNLTGCGIAAIRDHARATFDNGIAIFEVINFSYSPTESAIESLISNHWHLHHQICCRQ